MSRCLSALVFAAVALVAMPAARAQQASARIAIWDIDALGIDQEIVDRLEALFRTELERLSGKPLPTRREVADAVGNGPLRRCTGDPACLTEIGRKLGVDIVVAGNVGRLGDSYIVNLKAVRTADGAEMARVATEPLSGQPDELIESVRVAAYQLVAPDKLYGAVAVLTDLVGATVELDGERVGRTPLEAPLAQLALGVHRLRVTADDYSPFESEVRVRFQKTTRVVVNLVRADVAPPGVEFDPTLPPVERERRPWYSSGWAYAGVAVVAIAVGGWVGWQLGQTDVVDCGVSPEMCR